jgi:hypothetical protein
LTCAGCQQRADTIAAGLHAAGDRMHARKTSTLAMMLGSLGLVFVVGAVAGFAAGRAW